MSIDFKKVVERQTPAVAALFKAHAAILDTLQVQVDSLKQRIIDLEKRPARIYGGPDE